MKKKLFNFGQRTPISFSKSGGMWFLILISSSGLVNELLQLSIYPLNKIFYQLFNISASSFQHIIGLFFISSLIGSLLSSYISNKYNLYTSLFFGFIICFFGSIVSYTAFSIYLLSIGRLLFGLGAGLLSATSLAIIKKIYTPNEHVRVFGLINITVNTTALLAISTVLFFISSLSTPIISNFIAQTFSWNSVFLLITAVMIFYIFVCIKSKEFFSKIKYTTGKTKKIQLKNALLNIFNFRFVCYTSGLNLWILANTFIFIQTPILYTSLFEISTTKFVYLYALSTLFSLIGSAQSVWLNNFFEKIINFNIVLVCIVLNPLCFIILNFEFRLTYIDLFFLSCINNFLFGFMSPFIIKKQLNSVKEIEFVHFTSSIMQSITLVTCWISAIIAALVHEKSLMPLLMIMLCCSFLGLVIFIFESFYTD